MHAYILHTYMHAYIRTYVHAYMHIYKLYDTQINHFTRTHTVVILISLLAAVILQQLRADPRPSQAGPLRDGAVEARVLAEAQHREPDPTKNRSLAWEDVQGFFGPSFCPYVVLFWVFGLCGLPFFAWVLLDLLWFGTVLCFMRTAHCALFPAPQSCLGKKGRQAYRYTDQTPVSASHVQRWLLHPAGPSIVPVWNL